MNEASSKYVDQIAVEKLITEKLALVHHSPVAGSNNHQNGSDSDVIGFDDFTTLPPVPSGLKETGWQVIGERRKSTQIDKYTEGWLRYASFIPTPFSENNMVHVRGTRTTVQPKTGVVIFVHGLWEDNREIYQFLIAQLVGYGIDVYSLCLPYHYERKPADSLFSGEYFWSADLDRSALAYKQAVYDLYQLYRWLKNSVYRTVWIAGFSMGGGIALSLATLAELDGVFTINPVCNLSELVWNSRLFGPIRQDLDAAGINFSELKKRYAPFEPLSATAVRTDLRRIVLARSIYDQINDQANYDLLFDRWLPVESIAYKAGHLNILRVPRLAADIARYAAGESLKSPAKETNALDFG